MKSFSVNFALHTGLIVKVVLGAAATVIISLIVMYSPSIWGKAHHQWYQATYKCGMKFMGAKSKNGNQLEYFSVRVGNRQTQESMNECGLVLHWKGQKYLLRELRASDLAKVGITISKEGWLNGGEMAFMGGENCNNQDFGLEFYFKDGRICEFYARHSFQNGIACPFSLSIVGRANVSFPIGEKELKKSFGEPESLDPIPGK